MINKSKLIVDRIYTNDNALKDSNQQEIQSITKEITLVHQISSDFGNAPTLERFVRKNQLEKIKEKSNESQYVYLFGQSGVGKTTVARQYVADPQFNIVFWIDSSTIESVKLTFINLAQYLK